MDQMAYTPKRLHKKLLKETGLNISTARDNYDAVMHLVTAAIGAEEFYTLENNTARTETPEQARILDPKTHNAWVGIEHLKVIDNSTPLKGKLKKLLQSIARALGFPVPLEIEKRYLVKSLPNFKANDIHFQKIHIEQKYLVLKDGSLVRIRRRSQGGFDTFYKTIKIGEGLIRREASEIIVEKKYAELSQYQQKRTFTITKDRYCFLYKNQYFEFDKIHSPKKILFLEIELTEENDKIELPPFVKVIKEVTDDPSYSNYAISKG
jgi:CYTH domain-containing protein